MLFLILVAALPVQPAADSGKNSSPTSAARPGLSSPLVPPAPPASTPTLVQTNITPQSGGIAVIPGEGERLRIVFAAKSHGNYDLFEFDTSTGKALCLLETPEIETHPTVSPDGATVVFSRRAKELEPAHLWSMDLASRKVTQLTDTQSSDECAEFSPAGDYVYFVRAASLRNYSMGGKVWTDYDIYRIRVGGGGAAPEQVTGNQFFRGVSGIALSPGGDRIVFAVQYDLKAPSEKVYAIDVKGLAAPITVASKARLLTLGNAKTYECRPALSPDGSRLVFVSDATEPYHYNLWTSGPGGEKPRALTTDRRNVESPRFLRGGKTVVFLSEESPADGLNSRNAEMSIMELDLETGKVKQLTR